MPSETEQPQFSLLYHSILKARHLAVLEKEAKGFEASIEEKSHLVFRSRNEERLFIRGDRGRSHATNKTSKEGESTYIILGRGAVPVENYSPQSGRCVITVSTETAGAQTQGRYILEESWRALEEGLSERSLWM